MTKDLEEVYQAWYDDLMEKVAQGLYKIDYPLGGSIYKTWDSIPYEDREYYRNEARKLAS